VSPLISGLCLLICLSDYMGVRQWFVGVLIILMVEVISNWCVASCLLAWHGDGCSMQVFQVDSKELHYAIKL
jgi:hypothetical protein